MLFNVLIYKSDNMSIHQKIVEVNKVYRRLAIHTSTYKKSSGLGCQEGCSACCLKNDIEATVLEFLPAAYDIYRKGESDRYYDKLENTQDPVCVFYNPLNFGGACTNYQNRGLVCRVFGFSKKMNKYDQPELISCKIIKADMNKETINSTIHKAPDASAYSMKMFSIDQKLSTQYYPINEAIKKALETVIMHYHYRKKPA